MQGAVSGDPVASDEGRYSITLALTRAGTGWVMEETATGDQAKDYNCAGMALISLGVNASHWQR